MADLESEHSPPSHKERPEADPAARDSDSGLGGNVETVATALAKLLTEPMPQSFGPDTEVAQQPWVDREQGIEDRSESTGGLFGLEFLPPQERTAFRRRSNDVPRSHRTHAQASREQPG